jgi:hypothetical protein
MTTYLVLKERPGLAVGLIGYSTSVYISEADFSIL